MPRTPPTSFPSELPDQLDEIVADEISAPISMPEDDTPPPVLAKGTRSDVGDLARAAVQATTREHIALIAHDVRTPLSIITLEAELLQERLGDVPGAKPSLDRILHNTAFIERLVGDLLDLAAVEAGRFELRTERLDLGRLVVETLDRAVAMVDRERVRVHVRQRALVLGDAYRLERVVANLLSNALKYSHMTSPVTVTLEIVQQQRVRVAVTDQGIGMTPEQARTVFERGHRTDGARSRDGYGLGLYISRKIVDAHRGRIGVASTPGKGSRFFFELPLLG